MILRKEDYDELQIWIVVLLGLSFFTGVPVDSEWVFIFMIDINMLAEIAKQSHLGIIIWSLSLSARLGMLLCLFSIRRPWFCPLIITCSFIFLISQAVFMTLYSLCLIPYLIFLIITMIRIWQLNRPTYLLAHHLVKEAKDSSQ